MIGLMPISWLTCIYTINSSQNQQHCQFALLHCNLGHQLSGIQRQTSTYLTR